LKLNLEEGSTSIWGSAVYYQSAITMRFREVVDDRLVGLLLKVNEVSLAFPYVKSASNFNERHGCVLPVMSSLTCSAAAPDPSGGVFRTMQTPPKCLSQSSSVPS